jgi:acetyl-CoA acetyltransferase family protein
MKNVVIVEGLRTPYLKMGSDFQGMSAHELGAVNLKELLKRLDFNPADLDEVIVGNVAQPPEATNIARNIALLAGVPESVPAYSVQRNCSSGMQALAEAWYKIQLNEGSVYMTGGVENMSRIPLLWNEKATRWMGELFKAKTAGQKLALLTKFRFGFFKPIIGIMLGLTDGYNGLNMGQTAEILAKEFHITREEQDKFAMRSHNLAEKATEEGIFAQEIMPVPVAPDYKKVVDKDDGIRYGQSMEALAKLRPVFDRRNGTVTAGNSSQITDGAAMIMVMDEEKAKALGYQPIGRIKSFAFAGLDPARMGLGPAYSSKLVLEKSGMKMSDMDLIEINEAFAAQVIANLRIFESDTLSKKYLNLNKALGAIDENILNVNGGAVALGHPVGSSASRLVLTLLRELKRRGKETGLATLCVGGGQGAAFIVERM